MSLCLTPLLPTWSSSVLEHEPLSFLALWGREELQPPLLICFI